MFDLSNYFASASHVHVHVRTAMTSSKSSSSSDETASTTSVLSDSTPDTTGSRNDGGYNNSQAKHKHKHKHKNKDPPSNASNDDDINYEEQEVVHIPPKIAFQIFKLIELKRRSRVSTEDIKRSAGRVSSRQTMLHITLSLLHSSLIVLTGSYLYD